MNTLSRNRKVAIKHPLSLVKNFFSNDGSLMNLLDKNQYLHFNVYKSSSYHQIKKSLSSFDKDSASRIATYKTLKKENKLFHDNFKNAKNMKEYFNKKKKRKGDISQFDYLLKQYKEKGYKIPNLSLNHNIFKREPLLEDDSDTMKEGILAYPDPYGKDVYYLRKVRELVNIRLYPKKYAPKKRFKSVVDILPLNTEFTSIFKRDSRASDSITKWPSTSSLKKVSGSRNSSGRRSESLLLRYEKDCKKTFSSFKGEFKTCISEEKLSPFDIKHLDDEKTLLNQINLLLNLIEIENKSYIKKEEERKQNQEEEKNKREATEKIPRKLRQIFPVSKHSSRKLVFSREKILSSHKEEGKKSEENKVDNRSKNKKLPLKKMMTLLPRKGNKLSRFNSQEISEDPNNTTTKDLQNKEEKIYEEEKNLRPSAIKKTTQQQRGSSPNFRMRKLSRDIEMKIQFKRFGGVYNFLEYAYEQLLNHKYKEVFNMLQVYLETIKKKKEDEIDNILHPKELTKETMLANIEEVSDKIRKTDFTLKVRKIYSDLHRLREIKPTLRSLERSNKQLENMDRVFCKTISLK